MKTANKEFQEAVEKGADVAKMLTRDEILAVDDIGKEVVKVPEWGGSVLIWGLTGKERDSFEETMIEVKGKDTKRNFSNLRARLCARCIRDESGKRLFKGEYIEKLGLKSASALDRVFTVSQKLSGMSTEDVEEMTKN